MNVQQIGTRGFIFTFDDDISVYLIAGPRSSILCDTHLGPASMAQITGYLAGLPCSGRMIIFNSHSDWDHIWGNCSFPDSFIIGHELCKKRMMERGEYDLRQNASSRCGPVVLTPPNLTFSDRLSLEDDDVEFVYAPGHTIDSAVCYDRRDKDLYLGDLVEDPIPYLDDRDLDTYLLTHQAEILVCAHSGIVTWDLIEYNIASITKVRDGIPLESENFGVYREMHQWNMNVQMIFGSEPAFRNLFGDRYSLIHLLEQIGDIHALSQQI